MNHISFRIIQCPQKPLFIRALTSNTANPSPKKSHPIQLQATNLCKKRSKRANKNTESRKILQTTTMEMYGGERSSLRHSLRRPLKKPTTMEKIPSPWILTFIKPLPVHQYNAHLPLLPCSSRRNVSRRNVGSRQHLLSMLPFCATMTLCELNIS